jgi:cell division protein FtsB
MNATAVAPATLNGQTDLANRVRDLEATVAKLTKERDALENTIKKLLKEYANFSCTEEDMLETMRNAVRLDESFLDEIDAICRGEKVVADD